MVSGIASTQPPWPVTLFSALILLALGLAATRIQRLRIFAIGWSAGVAGTILMGGVAILFVLWHMV